VPDVVTTYMQRLYPKLLAAEAPFSLEGSGAELLFPSATTEDAACKFVRERVVEVATALGHEIKRARCRKPRAVRH
jgi:LysR family transcriptional regulator, mexEF-oprN operon transcriptional activator